MDEQWAELDELCSQARAPATAGDRPDATLLAELEALAPALARLDQSERELEALDHLLLVRQRLLRGAGVAQRVVVDFGLDRLAVLRWRAAADPRPELAAVQGEYRVEARFFLNEALKPVVEVVGAKRLRAGLPVTPEKFRAALLAAVRAPAFVPDAEEAPHAPTPEEAATTAAAEEAQSEPAPQAEAPAPEPAPTAEPAAATADRQEGPPAADEPIPMGPARAE